MSEVVKYIDTSVIANTKFKKLSEIKDRKSLDYRIQHFIPKQLLNNGGY